MILRNSIVREKCDVGGRRDVDVNRCKWNGDEKKKEINEKKKNPIIEKKNTPIMGRKPHLAFMFPWREDSGGNASLRFPLLY